MKRHTMNLLLAAGCGLFAVQCGDGGTPGLPGQCSLDFSGTVNSSFGDVRIDAVLEGTGAFSAAASAMEADIRTACNNICTDLGAETSDDTATACQNAVAAIDAVFAANAAANVTATFEYVPPVCSVEVSATMDCVAECDVNFDASATPPTCEGGELSGGCTGECSGSCTVEGSASCSGSCNASCTGSCSGNVSASCSGTCEGQCDGTCSVVNADGSCSGTCEGTCRGSCDADIEGSCEGTCEGSCSGGCTADVTGSCEGSCSGGCDVEFTEPKCEGGELTVEADADCQASCNAEASANMVCTEPSVVFSFSAEAAVDAQFNVLVATLEANLGVIVSIIDKAALVGSIGIDLGVSLGNLGSAAGDVGLEAVDCLRLAVEAQVAATASVSVSVEASASVSGSASGSAG